MGRYVMLTVRSAHMWCSNIYTQLHRSVLVFSVRVCVCVCWSQTPQRLICAFNVQYLDTCICSSIYFCNCTGRTIVSALVGDAEDGFAIYRLGYFFLPTISVSTQNGFTNMENRKCKLSRVICKPAFCMCMVEH